MNIRARKRRQLRAIGFDYRRQWTFLELCALEGLINDWDRAMKCIRFSVNIGSGDTP